MRLMKTAALTTVALSGLLAVGLYATAQAQTATPAQPAPNAAPKAAAPAQATPSAAPKAATPATPARPTVPRHPGTFSGGKIDQLTYVPTCPAFTMDMDAAAIQESSSKAFVEGEARRFETIREKWDAHEDCLTENARLDIEAIRTKLGDDLSNQANAEVTAFNALNAAAQANVDRVSKLAAPKAKKGAPAAAPAAAPPLSPWTTPTGRLVGSLSGNGQAPEYVTGCPSAVAAVTVADLGSVGTRDGFNALVEELKVMPGRINEVRTCRQDNGQQDYEAVQQAIEKGVNAVFVPRKNAFERTYSAVRFQLNEHRKAGGLLAPPELRRPAKAAPKAAPKKKK
jgi:hypothetical protein